MIKYNDAGNAQSVVSENGASSKGVAFGAKGSRDNDLKKSDTENNNEDDELLSSIHSIPPANLIEE